MVLHILQALQSLVYQAKVGMAQLLGKSRHPYYPRTAQLDGYSPATLSFDIILGVFGLVAALIIAVTWAASGVCATY